jgi:alkanesulfonate monooxygenase SsuD/methylene tetrahydromethanopterin reductase-like flavin-dependent oxidoreductase (luciferase family)
VAINEQDIIYRLRKRAEIRRQIPGRKSVVEGTPDRIADLLEEAADEMERLRQIIEDHDIRLDC